MNVTRRGLILAGIALLTFGLIPLVGLHVPWVLPGTLNIVNSTGTLEVVTRCGRSGRRSRAFLRVVSSHEVCFTVKRSNSAASKRVPCSTIGGCDSVDLCSSMVMGSPLGVMACVALQFFSETL